MSKTSPHADPGIFSAEAPLVEEPLLEGGGLSTQLLLSADEGVLLYLGRFLKQASIEGVATPVERALLEGATATFRDILAVCEALLESDSVAIPEPTAEGDLDSAGPKKRRKTKTSRRPKAAKSKPSD